MHKTLPVEIVGGEPNGFLGIPGFVFVAIAAVLASFVAAGVAIWRMRTELEHDRQMRNRDDARDTVYSALDAVDAAMEATALVEGAVEVIQESMGGDDSDPDEIKRLQEKASEEYRSAREHTIRIGMLATRLRVRLDSPDLSDELGKVFRNFRSHNELLGTARTRKFTRKEWEQVISADKRGDELITAFARSCYLWFNDFDAHR